MIHLSKVLNVITLVESASDRNWVAYARAEQPVDESR